MDEKEFGRRAAEALRKLDDALRDLEGVESDLAGDILTLEFEDGAKFVVNSHTAAQQIWLSANMQAWHFGWNDQAQRWRDSRSGAELFAELGSGISLAFLTGLVLEKALSVTESLDQLALRKAIFSLSGQLKTLDGNFELDPTGAQIGEITPLGQLVNEGGHVKFVTVWPHDVATGKQAF